MTQWHMYMVTHVPHDTHVHRDICRCWHTILRDHLDTSSWHLYIIMYMNMIMYMYILTEHLDTPSRHTTLAHHLDTLPWQPILIITYILTIFPKEALLSEKLGVLWERMRMVWQKRDCDRRCVTCDRRWVTCDQTAILTKTAVATTKPACQRQRPVSDRGLSATLLQTALCLSATLLPNKQLYRVDERRALTRKHARVHVWNTGRERKFFGRERKFFMSVKWRAACAHLVVFALMRAWSRRVTCALMCNFPPTLTRNFTRAHVHVCVWACVCFLCVGARVCVFVCDDDDWFYYFQK